MVDHAATLAVETGNTDTWWTMYSASSGKNWKHRHMVDNVEPLAAKTGNTETLWSLVDHVAPLEVETGNTDKWWTLDSATFLCMATSLKSWAL